MRECARSLSRSGMTGFRLTVDRRRIAVRIRALLYPMIRKSGTRAVAADLDVSADNLQTSIDLENPHPSVEVVLAVIRYHGVDPTWLLTGEYDLATHREALENPSSAVTLLARTPLRRERSLSLADVDQGPDPGNGLPSPSYSLPEITPPDPGEQPTA